jgi:starch synthase
MFIIQIASELAPVAKIGGLGDVVFGLSRELEIRGHDVEIILPKYDCLGYDQIYHLCVAYNDLWVPWYGAAIHCTVWFGFVHGRKCYFIDPHSRDNFFNRGGFYGWHDDNMRFAFFSKAALEFMLKANKRPDIIHCHDWQAGLVPVLLYEIYHKHGMPHQRVCYTIHNFKFQGLAGEDVLWATGLNRPEYYYRYERLRDHGNPHALNCMKGGIVYSNYVNTVSPHHAWEARFTAEGYGLSSTLHRYHDRFGGILNGVDYGIWNPEVDTHIPARYSRDNIEEKYRNKEALRNRMWLWKGYKPIISYVGRLDPQKGVHLIRHALFYALEHGAQFVLLGVSPEKSVSDQFWGLKRETNDNPDCHIELSFDEHLSHLVYAGSDMIIVPSMYEPCGLAQMIAVKYGTVPIVRYTGGLADTVFDWNHSDRPALERNGYVFHQSDFPALDSALDRAIGLWYNYPEQFRQLMLNGMNYDFSWNHPAKHYLDVYEFIRHK